MIAPNTILDDRFQIVEMMCEGGMGRVWTAKDLKNNSAKIIIKEIKMEHIENEYVLNGFFREVEALKRIQHDGVVKFLAAGKQENGTPYLAIEFISGTPLRSQIKQGGMTDLNRIATIFLQLGAAISAAHDSSIYHRDLKLEN